MDALVIHWFRLDNMDDARRAVDTTNQNETSIETNTVNRSDDTTKSKN